MLNRWASCLFLIPALNALRHTYLYLWISYIIKDIIADFLYLVVFGEKPEATQISKQG